MSRLAKLALEKDAVHLHDFLNIDDYFLNLDTELLSDDELRFCVRYMELVSSKFNRTALFWGSSNHNRKRLMAFASHNLISSHCIANKSDVGRSGSHRLGRYFQGVAYLLKKSASSALVPLTHKRGASLGGAQ